MNNFRFHFTTNHIRKSFQWVMESDEYHGIAIIELQWVSKWYKDRNPQWEQEQNAELERCQKTANLLQSAPDMLEALRAAKNGDMSLIDEAIDKAEGRLDWLGGPMETTHAQATIYNNTSGIAY